MSLLVDTLEYDNNQNNDMERIFHIRKKTFADRLGWNVKYVNELEFNEFDGEKTDYIVVRHKGEIVASCRLIPTTSPTMLSDIFPCLLRGEPLIPTRTVFEISRPPSIGETPNKRAALPLILSGLADYASKRDPAGLLRSALVRICFGSGWPATGNRSDDLVIGSGAIFAPMAMGRSSGR